MIQNWTEAEALATAMLVVTSMAGILYAGVQLRHERQYRAVTNLEKQLAFFHSTKFREARQRLAAERLNEQGELVRLDSDSLPIAALEVLDFYEHLGLLLKKSHLELYDVWHTFYEWAQPVYADFRRVLEDPSNELSDHYSDFRSMMHGMHRIQQQRMRKRHVDDQKLWSEERICEHYRYELQTAGEYMPARRSHTLSPRRGPFSMAGLTRRAAQQEN